MAPPICPGHGPMRVEWTSGEHRICKCQTCGAVDEVDKWDALAYALLDAEVGLLPAPAHLKCMTCGEVGADCTCARDASEQQAAVMIMTLLESFQPDSAIRVLDAIKM
jgi:hypothetical protein